MFQNSTLFRDPVTDTTALRSEGAGSPSLSPLPTSSQLEKQSHNPVFPLLMRQSPGCLARCGRSSHHSLGSPGFIPFSFSSKSLSHPHLLPKEQALMDQARVFQGSAVSLFSAWTVLIPH